MGDFKMNNLKRYKKDLERLIQEGEILYHSIRYECNSKAYERDIRKKLKDDTLEFINKLPKFSEKYEDWYSEAKTLIRQLLPLRLDDFVGYYEKPRGRKEINCESYRISDYLMGLKMVSEKKESKVIVGLDSAIPRFRQQLAILKAVKSRFESSLFDIEQLVRADMLDSELQAAGVLVKQGFLRAAGAVAGVVMEKHLAQVCENHQIAIRKKNPAIADFNDRLKTEGVIDLPQWRFNQHLADIRNRCVHNKDKEPSKDEVTGLVDGVKKLAKTLF